MTDKLAMLDELSKLAMQGPWKSCTGSKSHGGLCMCGMIYSIPADVPVVVALSHLDQNYTLGEGPTVEAKALNSKLICALVNNASTLIEVIRRQRNALETCRKDIGWFNEVITTTNELLEGLTL